jgi:DNA-binding transcriptional LysR family regulator
MLSWDDFRFVLALSRRHSLKAAGRDLGCDQATAGRRIYALERELGVELFEKRSDGFFLTTAGQRILGTLEQIEAGFEGIDRGLAGRDERPEGVVRVAMPGALANFGVIPRLRAFLAAHPRLELQFLTGPEVLNLAKREADVAVRLVKPKQSELVYRRIGELKLAFYVSRTLAPRGAPKKDEILKLPFVGLFENATSRLEASLLEGLAPAPRPNLRSAAWSSVASALRSGLGWGILPTFVGDSINEVRRIEAFDTASTPLWLVVHPDVQNSARVRAVIDFLSDALRKDTQRSA